MANEINSRVLTGIIVNSSNRKHKRSSFESETSKQIHTQLLIKLATHSKVRKVSKQ